MSFMSFVKDHKGALIGAACGSWSGALIGSKFDHKASHKHHKHHGGDHGDKALKAELQQTQAQLQQLQQLFFSQGTTGMPPQTSLLSPCSPSSLNYFGY